MGELKVKGDARFKDKVKVDGDAVFNATLRNSALSGTGERLVFVDANGNFKVGPGNPFPGTISSACVPGMLPWYEGGNNVGGAGNNTIGTCNIKDFVLKANNTNRIWIKPDGTISFGLDQNSNTGGKEYKFDGGAVRLSGQASGFGAPILVFDGGSPFGDWGIEYIDNKIHTQFNKSGLNFWKPFGSPNSWNYLMYLADDGMIGIGTDLPTTRLTIDSWNDDGIYVKTNSNKKTFSSLNKTTGKETFVVYSDGRTYIGDQKPILTGPHASAKLAVDGRILAKEIFVNIHNSTWADFVFDKDYKLMSLNDVEKFIIENKHLPNVPSAKDLTNTDDYNLSLAEMQRIQMEKIEELYLHVISQEKEINLLKAENKKLKEK